MDDLFNEPLKWKRVGGNEYTPGSAYLQHWVGAGKWGILDDGTFWEFNARDGPGLNERVIPCRRAERRRFPFSFFTSLHFGGVTCH